MRRLGWFMVGAAGATGALVAAPSLYGRLREAVGAGDPWNEFELEADGGYASLRETEPTDAEAPPAPAAEAEAEPEPESVVEPEPEPEPVAEAEPAVEAEPVADAEPEPEAEAAQSGAYETVVWPVPSAQPGEAEEPAAPEDEADDDDTADITSTLTPAPPPDDTEATDLRSRIEASRERLRHKAQGGDGGEDEAGDDTPDPGA